MVVVRATNGAWCILLRPENVDTDSGGIDDSARFLDLGPRLAKGKSKVQRTLLSRQCEQLPAALSKSHWRMGLSHVSSESTNDDRQSADGEIDVKNHGRKRPVPLLSFGDIDHTLELLLGAVVCPHWGTQGVEASPAASWSFWHNAFILCGLNVAGYQRTAKKKKTMEESRAFRDFMSAKRLL